MVNTAPYGGGYAPQGQQSYGAPQGSALPDPWDVVNSGGKSLNSMFNHKDQWGQNQSAPIGTFVEGVVASLPETFQRTDFDTKEPLFWPDGRPQLGIRFNADTAYQEAPDDDGRRSVSFQGTMLRALQDEMRAQGVKTFGVGTHFRITLVNLEPTKKGFPKKLYKVDLAAQPLSNPAVDQVLGGQPAQQQPQYVPVPQGGPGAVAQAGWAPQQAPQQPVQQQFPQVPQPQAQQPMQQFPQVPQPQAQQFPQAPQQPMQQQFPQQPPQAAPGGAAAVQGILGGQEVQQPQGGSIPVVTGEQIGQVQMLLSRNIPLREAALAVAGGDEALASALEANTPI
jgi:hypothetical protein